MSDLKKEFQYAIESAIGDVKLIIDNANEQQLQDVITFVKEKYCKDSTLGSWFKRMLNAYLWEKQEKNGTK